MGRVGRYDIDAGFTDLSDHADGLGSSRWLPHVFSFLFKSRARGGDIRRVDKRGGRNGSRLRWVPTDLGCFRRHHQLELTLNLRVGSLHRATRHRLEFRHSETQAERTTLNRD